MEVNVAPDTKPLLDKLPTCCNPTTLADAANNGPVDDSVAPAITPLTPAAEMVVPNTLPVADTLPANTTPDGTDKVAPDSMPVADTVVACTVVDRELTADSDAAWINPEVVNTVDEPAVPVMVIADPDMTVLMLVPIVSAAYCAAASTALTCKLGEPAVLVCKPDDDEEEEDAETAEAEP